MATTRSSEGGSSLRRSVGLTSRLPDPKGGEATSRAASHN